MYLIYLRTSSSITRAISSTLNSRAHGGPVAEAGLSLGLPFLTCHSSAWTLLLMKPSGQVMWISVYTGLLLRWGPENPCSWQSSFPIVLLGIPRIITAIASQNQRWEKQTYVPRQPVCKWCKSCGAKRTYLKQCSFSCSQWASDAWELAAVY